jgi:hypothetical protein
VAVVAELEMVVEQVDLHQLVVDPEEMIQTELEITQQVQPLAVEVAVEPEVEHQEVETVVEVW